MKNTTTQTLWGRVLRTCIAQIKQHDLTNPGCADRQIYPDSAKLDAEEYAKWYNRAEMLLRGAGEISHLVSPKMARKFDVIRGW